MKNVDTVGDNRLYMNRTMFDDEDNNYIVATSIIRLFDCDYVTTQIPTPSTCTDFWRMLSELNVEYVLVLQLPDLRDPVSFFFFSY